ncbi:3532_t:CDS:10 [Ambispora leptoticha]|uniref:Translation initiation factor eIF2B subunit epsilon n=1 Tax=Ambispora leptoticha TaxID=144679 RepID=A0A9N8YTK9_9GLOM|nr:3532_t:CDS:10 [Ambispora leptoticha]
MPPATKSSGKNLETETPLYAVLLADSFNERFRPITLEKPRCLLPLCNTPLIEYTLEFLAVAGVQEVVLFCREHADQIKAYLNASKWNRPHSPIKITTIITPEARSVGDVLRELDAKQLIDSDFILVCGDVVSNINLEQVLEAHRERKLVDKNAIMTMVVKEASPFHRTRAFSESSIFVLDGQTNECVHYEAVEIFPRKRRMVMDLEVFQKHTDVQIRNDLIDCQIDICSVEVPALFTENFDYQDIRNDFVYGILTSDLLGKTIYCHTVKDAYAARVRSLQTYDAISKDMLSRWTYPIVPDSNLQARDGYEFMRGQIYKEQDVVLARSCVLGERILIGTGTEIAGNSQITNTVIGRRVKIGPNVIIDGAYIWDDVTIKANCSVSRSILANGVVLEEKVIVNKGCLLSFNVVVGPNITLAPYTKLTTRLASPQYDGDEEGEREVVKVDAEDNQDEEIRKTEYDRQVIGALGIGYLWKDENLEEDDQDPRNLQVSSLAYDLSTLKMSGSESSASVISDDSEEESSDTEQQRQRKEEEDDDFSREVAQTLERAFAEGHTVENTVLELKALKMASNATFHDLRTVVIPCVLGQIDTQKFLFANQKEFASHVLTQWSPLISEVIHSSFDQLDALYILQEHCAARQESHARLLAPLLQQLYELEVVEEDAIIVWYNSDRAKGVGAGLATKQQEIVENIKKLRNMMTPFVKC